MKTRLKCQSQSECPKCDCEEVPEQYFQDEKSISAKNLCEHFTVKISADKTFGTHG